jgi:hypothetical protein
MSVSDLDYAPHGSDPVHSLTRGLSVGATLKLVRNATSTEVPSGSIDDLLDEANDLGEATNKFMDVGVSVVAGTLRAV